MKKYVALALFALLIGEASAYEYAGFDKFVDDVNTLVTNQTSNLIPPTPSTTTTTTPTLSDNGPITAITPSTTSTSTTEKGGGIIADTISYIVNAVSPSSSTADDSVKIITTSSTLPPQLSGDVIVKGQNLNSDEIAHIMTEYNADVVFNQLTENTEHCSKDCHSEYVLNNKEEIPLSQLGVEFYHDDHTFKHPSDNIVSYRILVWDGASWTTPQTIPAGTVRIRLEGTKTRDEDTAWRPKIEYSNVEVRQSRWALWKKGAESTPTLATGLIGAWHLDEATGTLADYSGTGSTCTNYNSSTQGATGILGSAIQFKTQTQYQYLNCGNTSVFRGIANENFTISYWFNQTSSTGGVDNDQFPITKTIDSGSNIDFWIEHYNQNAYMRMANATNILESSSIGNTFSLNTWYNMIFIYDNSTQLLHVYQNGVYKGNKSYAGMGRLSSSSASLILGIEGSGIMSANLQGRFNGTIDEVRIYNRTLSPSEVGDLYSFTSPIAEYHLNADGTDSSGNAFTMTGYNSPTYTAGVFNNGVTLDGKSQYFNLPSSVPFTFTNQPFAYGGWIKDTGPLSGPTGGRYVSIKHYSSYNMMLGLDKSVHEMFCGNRRESNGATLYTYASGSISDGKWHNVICVLNGTAQNIYVDGKINGTSVYSGGITIDTDSSAVLTLGSFAPTPGSFWNGSIDEFLIYKKALNDSEVQNLYESGITQLNITYPDNNTVFTGVGSVNAVVGFPDQTVANISYQDISGTWLVLKNNGVETNYSNIKLVKLNSTHYLVNATYSSSSGGTFNVTVAAWGGNGLVSSDSKTVFFTLSDSLGATGSDSLIRAKQGGVRILPVTNLFYVNVTGVSLRRPDGQYVCCGPDNNNQWTCTAGVCS